MAITQADFFIDASAGNDTNDGASAATALRTHAELEERIHAGGNLLIAPVSATFGKKIMTVHILTDLPDTDPINLNGVELGTDMLLHYKGGVASTDRSGTFTDVIAMDPATNQPFEVEDAAMSGTWKDDLGRRVRITSGPRENTVMWVAKDLGANRARVSDPSTFKALVGAPFDDDSFELKPQAPETGDDYAVETLRKVSLGLINMTSRAFNNSPDAEFPYVAFNEVEVRDESGFYFVSASLDGVAAAMLSCRLIPAWQGFTWPDGEFVNCFVNRGLLAIGLSMTYFNGGLVGVLEAQHDISSSNNIGIQSLGGGWVFLADDVMLQDVGMRGQNLIIQAASVFDAVATLNNPQGHGVFAGGSNVGYVGGTVSFTRFFSGKPFRLWGSGNTGVGVGVGPGAQLAYRTGTFPTITGAGGDFTLAGATSARAWDDAAGAYTSNRSTTWANLAATVASGGFGGNAHDATRDARIVDGL